MKPLDFYPAAADEVQEAFAYFQQISEELAEEFLDELAAGLERIRGNPQMYAAEDGERRIAPLQRFQYAVVYEELDDRIWVAAVSHHRRRPGYWKRRRPS